MPSLWKKKGKRISKLVVDLQTSPKRRETFVFENEISNSHIDIPTNNIDQLNKSSAKKKHFMKQNTTITTEDRKNSHLMFHTMSSKYVPQYNVEVPNSLNIEKNDEPVTKQTNLILDSINIEDNTCEKMDSVDKRIQVFGFWNSMFIIVVILGMIIYYKVFNQGIILITLFLLLLHEGEFNFPLLNYFLRGVFVVMVACNTETRVFGTVVGVFVLLGLEILKKVILRYSSFIDQLGFESLVKVVVKYTEKYVKKVSNKKSDKYLKKGVNEVEQELLLCDDVKIVENEADKSCFEIKINQLSKGCTPMDKSSYLEDEKIWNTIVSKIESLDRNYSTWPRNGESLVNYPTKTSEGKTKHEDECANNNAIKESSKVKKRRRLWKKLVPKHIRKTKKNNWTNNSNEVCIDCEEENFIDDGDIDIEDLVESSSSVSFEENEGLKEYCSPKSEIYSVPSKLFIAPNHKLFDEDSDPENKDFEGTKYNKIVSLDHNLEIDIESSYMEDKFIKWMIIMIISLIGLIAGRIYALVLTIIGCGLLCIFKN